MLKRLYESLSRLFIFITVICHLQFCHASTTSYSYDALNRLTNVDYGNGSVISYTYDSAGNRLTYVGAVVNDTTAPNIVITSPTSSPNFATSNNTVNLSGTASDNTTVSLITWSNDRGGIGAATGTNSWNIDGIHLQTGANVISVAAYDAAGNSTTAELTVTLSISVPNYTISLSASPGSGGTVSGSGTFAAASSRTASATPFSGYIFTNWTENGTIVSVSPDYTFTLSTNRTLIANFVSVVPSSPPNQLSGPIFSNGAFSFYLNGPTGSNFVIEVSSDLVHWTPFSTNTIPAQGPLIIVDADTASFSERFYRAVPINTISPSVPMLVASNLNGAGEMLLDGNVLYFTDNSSTDGIIKSVPKSGGPVSTLVTGLSGSDGHVPSFVIQNGTFYGGYGGYDSYNIFSAPASGGAATTLGSTTGGIFFGVAGSDIYYGVAFSFIDSITTAGAGPTQHASGNWVRGVAADDNAIYFSDFNSKDVRRYSISSGIVTPLITGNTSADGGLFIDANNVYFNNIGNILEVSKVGGSATILVSSGAATGYASDGTSVFYGETNSIKSVPVIGGTPTTVINLPENSFGSLVVDDNFIYWSDGSDGVGMGKIWRMLKP